MPIGHVLTTQRLRLEPCHPGHLAALQVLNGDPAVMQYITGRPETPEETAGMIERVQARWVQWGYSWWSFIERDSGQLIGAGCIQNLRRSGTEPDAACPVEIGWRLRPDRWHRGLASEAARAMAAFAFDTVEVDTLYAVCDPDNKASLAVMLRLGMRERGVEQWYERPVTTCEITAAEWRARQRSRD